MTWCRSAVNLSFFRCLAACRTRSSPCDTPLRFCARRVRGWPVFPLVPALCSTHSAAGRPALFAGFIARMAESDFSGPFIIGYGSSPSRCGPARYRGWSELEISRFPCKERACMPGSPTTPGRPSACAGALETSCLPLHRQRRHPEPVFYRGSMAGLHVPLPTLRRHPRGCPRTARGRCGSLFLHRRGLAPLTPCRSPGAPV